MKIVILMIGSLLTSLLLADNITIGTPIGNAIEQTKTVQKKKMKKMKRFRKDHHRYNKRYKNFDYKHKGYYNDDGFYFGFFDRRGYFYNNIYFEYNLEYTYLDRLYLRGFFRPTRHHYRRYRHHRDNDWNREHCYREPDVIVYHHYYDDRYYPPYREEHHYYYRDRDRDYDYYEHQRDSYRRDHNYDRRRDDYHRGHRRDNAKIRDRFSDKKSNPRRDRIENRGHSSSGRLQITK